MSDSRIARVIVFSHYMVAVFDQHGEQMPEHQGWLHEVWQGIAAEAEPDTPVQFGPYRMAATVRYVTLNAVSDYMQRSFDTYMENYNHWLDFYSSVAPEAVP